MANVFEAWGLTKQNEGGYSNNPNDTGGETYRGVSRVYFPSWSGWQFVDALPHPIKTNFVNNVLDLEAAKFYRTAFWDGILAEQIKNQAISNVIFDQAVIGGVGRTNDFVKDILNKKFGAKFDLNGKTSIAVIDKLNSIDANKFINTFNEYRKKFFLFSAGELPSYDRLYSFFKKYNKTAEDKKAKNKVFLSGWMKRVKRYEIAHSNFLTDLLGLFKKTPAK